MKLFVLLLSLQSFRAGSLPSLQFRNTTKLVPSTRETPNIPTATASRTEWLGSTERRRAGRVWSSCVVAARIDVDTNAPTDTIATELPETSELGCSHRERSTRSRSEQEVMDTG